MSDEPQPLRLKPRPPAGAEPSPPPAPPPPPPAAEQGEGTARLRLKPRLNLAEDKAKPVEAALPPEPFIPPPPPPSAPLAPEPSSEAPPAGDGIPVFKLRPKNAAPAPPPAFAPAPAFAPPPEPYAPPPPSFAAPPEPFNAPPPEPGSMGSEDLPPPPPPPIGKGTVSMPPMSVLSAHPPPAPGASPDAPPAPGAVPRLSLATPSAEKPAAPPKPALNIKVAEGTGKVGGKPIVKPGKPGKAPKPAAVLGKRSALSPVAKGGIAVLAVAVAVGGIYSYRIFFPPPAPVVIIQPLAIAKPVPKPIDPAAALAAKKKAEQAKVDAAVESEDVPTPTPTPATNATESVLAPADITSDVKVNTIHLDAAPAASAAFRTFVAGASIGGVFQGTPSRALINGSIVREGQIVDSTLGIEFERIDSDKKAIFFKDSTGAEVSKNY